MSSRPLPTLLEHLRGRLPVALGLALVALVLRIAAPAPPARTVDAIARMLGDAVGSAVGPDDFVWEERGGFLHDALIGRRVLFLAARGPGAADLHRARVRLTRSGRPMGLRDVHDLTGTPIGDDRNLVARGRLVAFTTTAFGAVQGVTLLDLNGDHADREARAPGERLRAALDAWLDTGSLRGAARTEISFETPPSAVLLDLTDDALVMALGPEALPAALDVRTGDLNTGGRDPFGARAQRIPRATPPTAALAGRLAARLWGPRAARAVARVASAARRAAPDRAPPPPARPAPPQASGPWPPAPIAPAVAPALPGEGAWSPVEAPFTLPAAPPGSDAEPGSAFFYATFLRPDPDRPGAWVHLLALDTRRIELRIQAGYAAPRPATGPRASGRLPAGPAATRVLGAIGVDAASRAEPPGDPAAEAPPAPGMIAGGRVLAPPLAGAPTLAVDLHGRPALGAWPFGPELPTALRSLWQAPPPDADGGPAERAALCLAPHGFLIHAWGRDLDPAALAAALARLRCDAVLPLGRAPAPLGFAFLASLGGGAWDAERLLPSMSIAPDRLKTASPGACLTLVAREPAPAAPLPEGAAWSPDGGRSPQPAWLPAVYAADVTHLGADVHLLAFSPDRFVFAVRAGAKEVAPRGGPALPGALAPEEAARALAAIGLGTGRRRGTRGLAVGGAVALRFRGEAGVLAVRGGRVEIHATTAVDVAPGMDAVELPLTADGGKLRPEGREIGSMRARAAACVLEDGTLLVARTTFDSDEATTEALVDAGCGRVVALDRGTHRAAFVHRAGGEAAPQASYDETALFALEIPMAGRAYGLGAAPAPRQ